jgi:FkbM family methyltransferase
MILNLRDGHKMEICPYHSEASIILDIWGLKSYTPKGFEINSKDVVFDIGGHIGSFSIYASSKAKNGNVFAFEPLITNHKKFTRNIKLNNIKNIILENKGIASTNGKRTFYTFTSKNSGTSSLYDGPNTKKITITTTTIKEVIKKNNIKKINFMKIDCEGAEYEILFNMPKNILSKIDKIAMEYHDIENHNHKELLTFFKKNGFITRKYASFIYAYKK